MLLYPLFFTIISILAILYVLYRFISGKSSLIFSILWSVLWIIVIIFAIVPKSSTYIANFFGISRGLDFLLIVAIISIFYLIIKLFSKLDKQQEDINKIVREIAIKNEIDLDKEE